MNRGYIFIFLATVFFSSMEVALKTVAHDFNPTGLFAMIAIIERGL